MKKIFIYLLLLFPFYLKAQIDWSHLKKESAAVYVFKISAIDAEKYIKEDSIPVDFFTSIEPFLIVKKKYIDTDLLPVGFFVSIKIIDNKIETELIGKTNLIVYPLLNQQVHFIEVRDKQGNNIENAKVWLNNTATKYNTTFKQYEIKQRKLPKIAFAKVYAPNDTTFVGFELKEPRQTVLKQRWMNLKSTKWMQVLTWLPNKCVQIFTKKRYYYKRKKSINNQGYLVFNQAKYKLTDTVKFKAHIVNKHEKIFKKPVNVFLRYYAKNKMYRQLLGKIVPTKAGSYIHSFKLSDTLFNDIGYTVELEDFKTKEVILKNSFKTEDYIIEEISYHKMTLNKEQYFYGDSVVVFATAKDANNLNLLDATATLTVTNEQPTSFEADSIYVADTLFVEKQKLLSNEDNKFIIPAFIFPKASMRLRAKIEFENSNHEIQTKEEVFTLTTLRREIRITNKTDSIYATYYENGIAKNAIGEMNIDGENNIEQSILVQYPIAVKVDPLAEDYSFCVLEKDSVVASASTTVKNYNELNFRRISNKDTAGFILENPYKIPVNYLVLDGNKTIATVKSSNDIISWQKQITQKKKLLTLKYSFIWRGKQIERTENIGLLHKIVNIEIEHLKKVFPGQKDSVVVTVTDFKNNAVPDFNLTAVAYNKQLYKNINVSTPPYIAHYKQKKNLYKGFYAMETEDVTFNKKYDLFKNIAWIKKMGVDSLVYYQLLFPKNEITDIVTPIANFLPQTALHVVENGIPQQINILYINNQIVYYSGTTQQMPYSFETNNIYNKIGIRLYNKYIEIDSVYIQPNYKHDISIDLQKLPANAKVSEMPDYYTINETNTLQRSILQLDYKVNNGFIWQQNKVIKINNAANYYQQNLIGPFNTYDSVHYYLPEHFDVQFKFEPNYIFQLSSKILRLEKNVIFNNYNFHGQQKIPTVNNYIWKHLGDTIIPPPIIKYTIPLAKKVINKSTVQEIQKFYTYNIANGKIKLNSIKDTSILYTIIERVDEKENAIVYPYFYEHFEKLAPQLYNIILITNHWLVAEKTINVKNNATVYIHANSWHFTSKTELIDSLTKLVEPNTKPLDVNISKPNLTNQKEKETATVNLTQYAEKGEEYIRGIVIDDKGKHGIPSATVYIKNTKTGVVCNNKGEFIINNIKAKKYTLVVSAIGYETNEKSIHLYTGINNFQIELKQSNVSLDEVVVIGYGTQRKKDITGSVATISNKTMQTENLEYALQGRVAGVQVNSSNGNPGAALSIAIRGTSSVSSNKVVYIIDGILFDEMPANISPDFIDKIETLNSENATKIFGSRVINGAIVITTKSKILRSEYRDYAFWQPELITDKNGKTSFVINYPDNITSWEAYFIGMDKKKRIGKYSTRIQSYKPIMAQLSVPSFLIEGDTVQLIGKISNYTQDAYPLKSRFLINKRLQDEQKHAIESNVSIATPLTVIATNEDSIYTSFNIETITGFKDGEERKIPVFKKGTEETMGQFLVLQKDTTIKIEPIKNASSIEIFATNNSIDVFLNELEQIRKYPYYCMEQTSSKLRGLLMEKAIKKALNRKFTNDKEIDALLNKILKAQQFNGSWGWWDAGKPNVHITNYIVQVLLSLKENNLVTIATRNGLLYLQNQLPHLSNNELLSTLQTLSKAKHAMQYDFVLQKLVFDSLNIHEQWQWVNIHQNLQLSYKRELDSLIKKANTGILGSMYWGNENYKWYNNQIATTVLAYETIKNEPTYQYIKLPIIQHFLSERKNGNWINTFASASIIHAILPDMLAVNKVVDKPAVLHINGDTNFVITTFPFVHKFNKNQQQIQVTKTGGGLTYFSAHQSFWNTQPSAFSEYFDITTTFNDNNNYLQYLTAGKKVKMVVQIQVKKEAEYVMIEAPIPGGCFYANKKQLGYNMHQEYFKNKWCIFSEKLTVGTYNFEVELEPRYTGRFTMNPAKASLMYFPTFYGRNALRSVTIQP